MLEEADDRLQAITAAAVIGLRAGADAGLLEPPTVVAARAADRGAHDAP